MQRYNLLSLPTLFNIDPDLIHVYRVEVPSKIIPLLTSRAEERNRIREMSEGGKYFDYAINRFVEEWEKIN